MPKPIEYRDEKGDLIASTEPRANVGWSVEDRMEELVREGRLIDPELMDAIHFAVAECSREVRAIGTMPFGDHGIKEFAERLYGSFQNGHELERGSAKRWTGTEYVDEYTWPPLPESVVAVLKGRAIENLGQSGDAPEVL